MRTTAVGAETGRLAEVLARLADYLEAREALPGVDVRLVKAVGRRDGRHFVVLDTEALLAPLLSAAAGGDRFHSRTS